MLLLYNNENKPKKEPMRATFSLTLIKRGTTSDTKKGAKKYFLRVLFIYCSWIAHYIFFVYIRYSAPKTLLGFLVTHTFNIELYLKPTSIFNNIRKVQNMC